MYRLLTILCCLSVLCPLDGLSHGERPRAIELVVAPGPSDTVWVLSDTQGIFANQKMGFTWTCEDAVSAGAATRGLGVMGPSSELWLLATAAGMFTSVDRGCNFHRTDGRVGYHDLVGLWRHPQRQEFLTASRTPTTVNDVFISSDRGGVWTPLGLSSQGRLPRSLGPQRCGRIYVHHRDGIERSDNLGATWERLDVTINNVRPGPESLHDLLVSLSMRTRCF